MYRTRATIIISIIITFGSSVLFLSSCKKKSNDGEIIFTRITENKDQANYITGDNWRYLSHSQIVAMDPGNSAASVKVLTPDFFSARSPQISYDGQHMLFTGMKNNNDPWQIWEMDLKNFRTRKILSSKENCTDPAYLPGNRLVFSKTIKNDSIKAGHSLFTCNLDGSAISRITFNPSAYFASTILKDGRILTIARQVFPDQKDAEFIVMRPDGTKAELFYQGLSGITLSDQPSETKDGKIVFIESDLNKDSKSDIISVTYNRPLHSRENLTSEIQGDFQSVFPLQSGNFLVSYRKSGPDRYALYEFDPVKKVLGQAIHSGDGYDDLEAVEARLHQRPKKLPSDVMPVIKTGLIMTQDINLHNNVSVDSNSSIAKAAKVEIIGLDSLLGVFEPEEDGSFYLKVLANKPFRIRTLDEDGHVIETCSWIWLRPNERRGCVGCHENQELAPENRIAMAVKKAPIKVPIHVNKIVEKKIDTE